MTEEQLSELTATLRSAMVDEIDRRIGMVIAVAEDAREALDRSDALASKLAGVTTALVEADGAMLQRIGQIEQVLDIFHRDGLRPTETFDLVEDWYAEEPRAEPKPVDTTPRIIHELRKKPGVLARLTKRDKSE